MQPGLSQKLQLHWIIFQLLSATPPSASPKPWLEGKHSFSEKAATWGVAVKETLRDLTGSS